MAGSRRSRCPVSCTLDVLGDRWSLLVVRDLFRGKHRYSEFAASPERIPSNILAERLRRLKARGIVRSRRYSGAPPRVEYHLTAKGEALRPIIRAMVDWGVRHAGGVVPPGYVATATAVVPVAADEPGPPR
ncbi:MAG: winged helix-turn-helix transcriptional regulator [Dehalococcoidia bacterium]